MKEQKIDVDFMVQELSRQIANLSVENAYLKAMLNKEKEEATSE